MFRRRAFKRSYKRRGGAVGGALKFATRYPGGNRVTQVPMAAVYFTKHTFLETENIGGGAAFTLIEYRPMSLFNQDLGGSDATYASQMLTFYNEYVVLGYSYRFMFQTLETGTGMEFALANWPNNSIPATFNDLKYLPGAKSQVLGISTGSTGQKWISGYINTTKLFGLNVAVNDSFWGVGTVSPPQECSLYVGVSNISGAAGNSYQIHMNLVTYVKWFNRNEVTTLPAVVGGQGGGPPGNALSVFGMAKGHLDRVGLIKRLKKQVIALEASLANKKKRPVVEPDPEDELLLD